MSSGGNVAAGASAVLVVQLTANPLPVLRWRKDGVELHDGANIAGASTSALTVSNFQTSDAGSYTVEATNTAGVATSTPVSLALASSPNPTPAPAPSVRSGGGGGGAAPGLWCAVLLAVLCVRRALRAG